MGCMLSKALEKIKSKENLIHIAGDKASRKHKKQYKMR